MFVSEGVSPKSEYPQKCLVESLWEIPGQKCSLSMPGSVPRQEISTVLLQQLTYTHAVRLHKVCHMSLGLGHFAHVPSRPSTGTASLAPPGPKADPLTAASSHVLGQAHSFSSDRATA